MSHSEFAPGSTARCGTCGELAADCGCKVQVTPKTLRPIRSRDFAQSPEWKAIADRFGIPEHGVKKIVLTLQHDAFVSVVVEYMPKEMAEPLPIEYEHR